VNYPKACIWGGCNGTIAASGKCDRCGTPQYEPQQIVEVEVAQEPVMTNVMCCHCHRMLDVADSVELNPDRIACFSCATGLPLDEFRRLKASGQRVPLLNER
jgi:hypothetical protein